MLMKKILIVGGGIAGLALAIQLKKHGVPCEVTLIEQAPEFKNVGYGIALWGNGRNVLREIGIDQGAITKEGYEIPWEAIETTSHKLLKVFFMEQFRKFGSTVVIPRYVLHKTLIEQLDPTVIKLNTKISAVRNNSNEGVDVELSDGSTGHYDLLVAADGINSWTREYVFGPDFIKPCGYSFWSFWIPGNHASKGIVTMAGDGELLFSYPGKDRAVMLLARRRAPGQLDDSITRREHLLENFNEFGSIVTDNINLLSDDDPILFSDAKHVSMPSWYKGRVVLIGDAQHAISPLTGMGASLALEDACVLAQELSKQDDINDALRAFSARRTPRVSKFQNQSHVLDKLAFSGGIVAKLRNIFMPLLPSSVVMRPIKELLEGEM